MVRLAAIVVVEMSDVVILGFPIQMQRIHLVALLVIVVHQMSVIQTQPQVSTQVATTPVVEGPVTVFADHSTETI